ncbi:hypothetical protein V6N13_134149 [Hibiscus sabdariffa]|uniref:AP-5 complex subunit zeta-1 ARM repeats domain-containing protein n=1 Tax=Hibiscus sabdariffa TaxID=183260 RepID=A0ABR2QZB5_9ROSI
MSDGEGGGEGDWNFYLQTVSNSARDSAVANDPASDPSLLHALKKLCDFCRQQQKPSEDLVARVYPHLSKLFHRSVASLSQSTTSNGLLLLVRVFVFFFFCLRVIENFVVA